MFNSYNIFNYHKLDQSINLKEKKSNKNVILLPDYKTFLINNSIKIKKNHHLSKVLNDDLKNKKYFKEIINELIDKVIINISMKSVLSDLLKSVYIKNEIKTTLNNLISDIENNNNFYNFINSINEDDFSQENNTGIPLKSFLTVGYYLDQKNQ